MADRFSSSESSGKAAQRPEKALRSTESVVFVDVGTKRIDANVIRDGVPVGVHQINADVLDDIIVGRPKLVLRVVGQSIPAGTPVPLGTAVNLVLAPASQLPLGVLVGTLTDLSNVPIQRAYETHVAPNRLQVNRVVTRAASGTLAPEDEATVRQIFGRMEIEIDDRPGHDVNAAVETLRALTTFGG